MADRKAGNLQRGFTLIELMVSVAIISLLLALLMPAIMKARESARRTTCRNRLRQLGLAVWNYEGIHSTLPPGSQVMKIRSADGFSKSFGWPVALLPQLDQANLFLQFDFHLDCQIHHRDLTKQILPVFVCPSDPAAGERVIWDGDGFSGDPWGRFFDGGWGGLNYIGVSGVDGYVVINDRTDCNRIPDPQLHAGMFYGNSSVRARDVTDGLSQTLMFGERGITAQRGKWGGAGAPHRCPAGLADVVLPGIIASKGFGGLQMPVGSPADAASWWSFHDGGTHFCLGDGAVRFFSYSTDAIVIQGLSTRASGEIVNHDW